MSADHIHRLLDEAFAGIPYSPETQDLKEEIRANLLARAEELERAGVAPAEAARRALGELGDVRALVESAGEESATSAAPPLPTNADAHVPFAWQRAFALHRVRPQAGFVVRTVIASLVAVGSLVSAGFAVAGLVMLHGLGSGGVPALWGAIVVLALAALAIGWIVGDALGQETTTNHPMPRGRAIGYGAASALVVFALGLGGILAAGLLPLWSAAIAAVPFVIGIIVFSHLGATQTNRHKAWVLDLQRTHRDLGNRFDEDPASAARFGMYTAAIWVTSFIAFVVLGFAWTWAWAWIVFPVAFIAMFVLLARMLFPPSD